MAKRTIAEIIELAKTNITALTPDEVRVLRSIGKTKDDTGSLAAYALDETQAILSEHDLTTKEGQNAAFLELFSAVAMTMRGAARAIGISTRVLYQRIHDSPELREQYQAAKRKQNRLRLGEVEDAVFQQIIAGKAAPGVTIFWLKRFGGVEWHNADKHVLAHTGNMTLGVGVRELSDEMLLEMVRTEEGSGPAETRLLTSGEDGDGEQANPQTREEKKEMDR